MNTLIKTWAWLVFVCVFATACIGGAGKDGWSTISSPPTVIIQEPSDGSSFRTAEPILFKAFFQSTIYTPDQLSHTWSAGPTTICETAAVNADGYGTCTWTFYDFGEQTVTVSVVDPNSDFGDYTITINIVENFPPSITVNNPVADGIYDSSDLVDINLLVDDAEDAAHDLTLHIETNIDGVTEALNVPEEVPSDGQYKTSVALTPGEQQLTFTVTDTLGAYASSTFLVVVTQSPSAPVVSIAPDPARSGEQLNAQIDVESTDPDGDDITYSYSWIIDSTQLSLPATKDFIDATTTERGQNVELWVTPSDGYLEGPPGYALLTIGNSPPALTGCSITPSSPLGDDELTAVPSGWSDYDGDPEDHTYNWLVKEGTNWIDAGVITATYPASATERDQILKVECIPFDGYEEGASVTSSSVQIGNSVPSIGSCSITPGSPDTDNKLTANPSGLDDSDNDPVSVTYEWSVNGSIQNGVTGNTLNKSKTLKGDVVDVYCTPNDGIVDGTGASSSVTIGNSAPGDATVSFSPADAETNDRIDVLIDTEAADSDGDSLTYTYEFSANGTLQQGPSSKSYISKNIVQRDETWSVSVIANDGTASGPAANADITIANAAPTLTDCEITPASPGTTDDLFGEGSGFSDLEGDAEDYAYTWYIDYDDGNGWIEVRDTKKLPSSFTAIDYQIKVACTADDGFDLGNTIESSPISVQNTAPSATTCSLAGLGSDPSQPLTADELQVAGSGFSDPDGDPAQFRFRWFRNGIQDASITDDTDPAYPSTNTSKGQQIHAECIPYDDFAGDGTPVASNTLTIVNTGPEAPVVSLSPDPATTLSTLQVIIDYQEPDPDGDAISYIYSWNLSSSTSSAISPGSTSRDETWTVSVTACDTDATLPKCSATAGSASVTIENSAPALTDCYIDPVTPSSQDDLSAVTVGWNDPDGDSESVVFEWQQFDGSTWDTIGTSSSTLPASLTSRDTDYKVVCTPVNGTTQGPALESSPITVQNSAPELSSCSISPSAPSTAEDLTAIPNGWSDTDGDPAGYQFTWYINGFNQATTTDPVLLSTVHQKGDQLQVDCIPDDGLDTGPAATSNSVTVVNTAPEAPTISIDPASPSTDDMLSALIVTDSLDADNDSISYSYEWTKDGGSTPHASSTIASALTDTNEYWAVTITPNDSESDGPTVVAAVTIGNSAPSITGCSVTPTSPITGDSLTVSSSGWYDPDGDLEQVDFEWFSYDGASWTSLGTGTTLDSSATARGLDIKATCSPYNGAGAGTSYGSPLDSSTTTIGNTPPELDACSIAPPSPTTGDDLTVTLTGWDDPDGDSEDALYTWYVNGSPDGSVTTSNYPSASTMSGDNVYVVCAPNDGLDTGTSVTSSTVNITNSGPEIASCEIDNYTPTTGENLSAFVTGWTDPDGDPENVDYVWTLNGTENTTITTNFFPSTLTAKNDVITVRCTPLDSGGTGAPLDSTQALVQNSVPSISSCDIQSSSGNYQTLDDLTVAITGWDDPDGDSQGITYEWSVNSSIYSTASSLGASDFVKTDAIQVICTPNDGEDDGSPLASSVVTIQNTPATITECTLTPASPSNDDDLLTALVGWDDPDGDLEGAQYAWYVNSVLDSTATAATYPSTSTSTDDQIYVVCSPDDGEDLGAGLTSDTRTVGNSAPSITGCSLSSMSPATLDDIVVSLDGWSDADGDSPGATYEWYVDQILDSQITTNTYPANRTSKGESVYVRCTPDDGQSTGAPADSSPAVVINTAPTLTGCDIASASGLFGTTDELSVTLNGWDDVDGDAEGADYAWWVNGVVKSTDAVLTTDKFVKNDSVYLACTANDGESTGNSVTSSTITIENSPPVITDCTLSPIGPATTDDLTAAVVGWNDPDSDIDSTTFVWYVNGGLDTSVTGSSYSSTLTTSDDIVHVVCNPFDGTDTGHSITSSTVTVGDTPPSITDCILDNYAPATDENITASVQGWDDPDGDPESVVYAWLVNGIEDTSITSDLFPSSLSSKGDIITARCTPVDTGSVGAPIDSNPATVVNSSPEITGCSVSTSSGNFHTLDDMTATTVGWFDLDGDANQSEYEWYVNGAPAGNTAATLDAANFQKGDQVHVECTPNDGQALGSPIASSAVTIENTAPGISDCTLTPLSPATTDDLLVSTAGWADNDGDNELTEFAWYVGGVLDGSVTGPTYPNTSTLFGDQLYVTCTAYDGEDQGNTLTSEIRTVGNSAPSITDCVLDNTNPTTSEDITASLVGWSDADGDPEGATYQWYVNQVIDTQVAGNIFPANRTAKNDDVYVQCTPGDGLSTGPTVSSASATVANSAPSLGNCQIISTSGTLGTEEDLAVQTAGWSDPDGDAEGSSIEWFVNGVTTGTGPELDSSSFVKGDVITAECTPWDGDAPAGTPLMTSDIIIPNTAAAVSNVTITAQGSGGTGDTLNCTHTYVDPDLDLDLSTVDWYIDGAASGTGPTLSSGFVGGQEIICMVTAYDGVDYGNTDQDTFNVVNTPPVISAASITPDPAVYGDALLCGYTYTDADDQAASSDSSTYAWTVNSISAGTTSQHLTSGFDGGDTVQCTIVANDGTEDGNSLSPSLVIDNTAPSVSGINISCGNDCLAGDVLTCNYSFVDVDLDQDQSEFTWTVNTVAAGSQTDTLTTGFDGGDTVVCTISPYDGIDYGLDASGTLTIGNSIPAISGVQILSSSGSFIFGDTLTCDYTFDDADGDPDLTTFVWRVNGGGTVSTTATLSTGFGGGDTVSCEATPFDGLNNGTPVEVDVQINNTAPSVTDVTILPDPGYAADALTCTYTFDDVDGDSSSSAYSWTINGNAAGTNNSDLVGGFVYTDTIVCTVTPNDGQTNGTTDTGNLVVSNTLPTINSVTLSSDSAVSGDGDPSTAVVGDTLTCAYSFTDPDCATGNCDQSAYAWTVNSTPIAPTSATLSTDFVGGDSVQCTVTSNDGTSSGGSDSASIGITNSIPSVASVQIAPNPATTSDDLDCTWTYDDADGNLEQSTVAWYIDGVFSTSGISLAAHTAIGGNVVTCEVTPFDGIVFGTPVSDVLTLDNSIPAVSGATVVVNTGQAGDTFVCDYSYTDADNNLDSSIVSWSINTVFAANGTTFAGAFVSGDIVTCEVAAYDGTDYGNSSSDSYTVLNTLPIVQNVDIAPTPADASDVLTCTYGFVDNDSSNDQSTIEWTVNSVAAGTTNTISGSFIGGQIVRCTVTPNDGEDAGTPSYAEVTIDNSVPTVTGVTITPASPVYGEQPTCTYVFNDIDNNQDNSTIQWTIDSAPAGTNAQLTNAIYGGDTLVCTVTPNDGVGGIGLPASTSVTVANTAPTIASIVISPSDAKIADTLTCGYSYTDVDNDQDQSAIQWTDSTGSVLGSTNTLSGQFQRDDVITCTVSAHDGINAGNTLTVDTTIQNTAPSLGGCTIGPSNPATTDDLVVSSLDNWSDADPQDPTAGAQYAWYVDGLVDSSITGNTFPASSTASGEDIHVNCTADDGIDIGNTVTSNTLSVENTPPSITGCALNTLSPTTTTNLTASLQGWVDPDNTPENANYTWYVNSQVVTGATTGTLSSTLFIKGDDVHVVCEPDDGNATGTTASTATATVINTPPSITGCDITTTSPYTTDDIVVSYSGWTDPDVNDSPAALFAWNKNTVLDSTQTAASYPSSRTVKSDVIDSICTAWDGEESGNAVNSNSVTVINTQPVVSNASIAAAAPGAAGSILTCTYTYADADNDGTLSTIEWKNGSTVIGTGNTVSTGFVGGDTVTCTVTGADDEGTGNQTSDSLVIANTAPTATGLDLNPDPAYADDSIACTFTFNDVDGDSNLSTYAWKINGSLQSATGNILSTGFVGGDVVKCTVTPKDPYSVGIPQEVELTVSNTAPNAVSLNISCSGTCQAGDTLTCGYTFTDIDGQNDNSSVEWTNGTTVIGNNNTVSTGFDGGDTVTCTVTPNDGIVDGPAQNTNVLIGNSAPSVSSVYVTPSGPAADSTLTCNYTYADPDNDADQSLITWHVNGGGNFGGGTTHSGGISGGDTVNCEVTPNDGTLSGTMQPSPAVTVQNTAPVVSNVAVGPSGALANSTLDCTYSLADIDSNDTDNSAYAWRINSTLLAGATGSSLASGFVGGDTVRCTVTANDNHTNGNTDFGEIVIGNTAPIVSGISLDPQPLLAGQSVICNYSFSDIDNQSDSSNIQWYVNSVLQSETSNTLSGVVGGQTVQCMVTANDGIVDGNTIQATDTVDNTNPVVTNVTITPPSAVYGTDLTCTYNWSDADNNGDNSTIRWLVNTTPVGTSTALTNDVFYGGNLVTCEITPNDGIGGPQAPVSASLTVGNTPPTVAAVTITPVSPVVTSALFCDHSYSDVDNDSDQSTFEWTNSTGTVLGTTNTLSTGFQRGDTITCTVTSNDGAVNGNSSSDVKTIQNTAPNLGGCTIAPSAPETTDNITVVSLDNWVDPDPQDTTPGAQHTWYVNGTPDSSITGNSYPAANTQSGDSVYVSCTADDSIDTGNTVSSNVLAIANTPPSITDCTLNTTTPTTTDSLSATLVGWSDPDNTAAGADYAWYVNGIIVNGATGATLSSSNYIKNNDVYVICTPNDGSATGTPVTSSTATVANTAPSFSACTLQDTTVHTTETPYVVASGWSDPDTNDTPGYDYSWTVNTIVDTAQSTDTYPPASTSKGDVVQASCTANDGTNTGNTVQSGSITILNTPPVVSNAVITPASNGAVGDTLTCSYTHVDADNDGDLSTIQWLNGTTPIGSGITLNTGFLGGDAVYCVVTGIDDEATGNQTTSPGFFVPNTAPTVSSLGLTPSPAYAASTIVCDYTYFDSDNNGDQSTYQWFIDGALQSSTTNSLSAGFIGTDIVKCTVTPNDGITTGTPQSVQLTVSNTVPSVNSMSIGCSGTCQAGETLTCNYTFDDDDGQNDVSTIEWTNGGAVIGTNPTLNSGFDGGDTVTCTVTPYDGVAYGTPSDTSISIGNSTPSVSGVNITPTAPIATALLTCNYTFYDPDGDGDLSTVSWHIDGGPSVGSGTTHSGGLSGGDVVTCTVTPNDGSSSGVPQTSADVTILNSAPSVSGVTVGPAGATAASTLSCTYSFSDIDPNDVDSSTYAWTVGGVTVSNETSATLSSAFVGAQVVRCTVTANDGHVNGNASYGELTILNTPPSVSGASLSPLPLLAGQPVTCGYSFTDIDTNQSDNSSIAWYVNNNPQSETSNTFSNFVGAQTVKCVVTANDGVVDGNTIEASATVNNTAPVVTSVLISPQSAVYDTDLSCTYNWYDADNNGDNSVTRWKVNGAVVHTGSALTSQSFLGGETVTCEVTPDDGITGPGTPVTDSIVVGNTPPTATNVQIGPSSPYTTNDLWCNFDFDDVDNDPNNSTYEWRVANTQSGTGSIAGTTSNLSSSLFTKDQWVTCEVTPNDSTTDGTAASDQVQILNSTPSVSAAAVSPSAITSATPSASCDYTFSDADSGDADSSVVKWYIDGSEVHTGTSYTGPFAGGTLLHCAVTANDGTATGNTIATSTVTVGNTPPVVSNVSIDSAVAPVYGTDLICNYTFYDADNYYDPNNNQDVSLVEWLVNDIVVSTGVNLDADVFSGGDTVKCRVTPKDDAGGIGIAQTDTIVIGNTAPVVSNVTIAPATAYTLDDLLCTFGYSDDDNDPNNSTIEWRAANSQGGAGIVVGNLATLDSSNFLRDKWVTCTVTANDGITNGNTISAQIQILNSVPVVSAPSVIPNPATAATSQLTCDYTFVDDDIDNDVSDVTWYKNAGQTATGTNYTGPYYGGDDIYCTVQAKDGSATGNTVTSATITIDNTVPSVSDVKITPVAVVYGTNLTCEYVWTDIDQNGDNSSIIWKIDGIPHATTGAYLNADDFVYNDVVSCEVTPNDGVGGIGTMVPASTTVGNTAPTVSGVVVTPNPAYTDDNLVCNYTQTDVDGQAPNPTIEWTVSATSGGAGTPVGSGTQTLDFSNFSRDEWVTCKVTPYDGISYGTSSSDEIQITNSLPSVSNATISPSSAVAATPNLTCMYTFTDADPLDTDNSTVHWFKNGIEDGTGTSYTGPYIGGDDLFCAVVARDGTNAGNVITSSILTVSNTLPTATFQSIIPGNPTTQSTLTCNITSDDDDGNNVTVLYLWYVGSTLVQSGSSNSFSGPFSYAQVVTCAGIPNDGIADGNAAYGNVYIVNAAPTVVSITATALPSSSQANTESTYAATLNGYGDPDGHPQGAHQYQWKVNNINVAGETGSTMPAGYAVRGDDVTVSVQPCDNLSKCGSTYTSNTVDVLNATPTSPTVSITPIVAEEDDDLSCNISTSATDPDNDPTTYAYEWTVQGGAQFTTTQTLSSGYTSLGETWECRARAIDDQADAYSTGPWSSVATKTIEDITNPPAPTLLTIDPYINDTFFTVQGQYCEIGNSCDLNCLDSNNNIYNYPDLACANGGGVGFFNATVSGIPRGESMTCTAICEDPSGNFSSPSNQIDTSVCVVDDVYEDGVGTGDSSASPVDQWSIIYDEPATSINPIQGTILKESGTWDGDWYVLDTKDLVQVSTTSDWDNDYNFRVDVANSLQGLYTVKVYRGGTAAQDAECRSNSVGYTTYNDCTFDTYTGNPSFHLGNNTNICFDAVAWPTQRYNHCDDLSNSYYIQVIRDPAKAESCDYYTLSISNGLTQAGTNVCETGGLPN